MTAARRCNRCIVRLSLAALSLGALLRSAQPQEADVSRTPRLRRPVAMVRQGDEERLFVANQQSGSISVIDPGLNKIVAEYAVGRKLSDLVALRDEQHLAAADEAAGQLILLQRRGATLKELERLDVPAAPVGLELSDDGGQLAAACLWGRCVALVDLVVGKQRAGGKNWRVAKIVELPFAPRKMCFIAESTKLVVADAFGGRLALVDAEQGKLLSVRDLPGHNLRGMTTAGGGRWLLIAHQTASPLARADREDIHWGALLRNNLRWLSSEYVAGEHADLLAASRLEFLGGPDNGAADPGEVLALSDGRVAVAVSGVDALLLSRDDAAGYQRIDVGRRPAALAASSDGQRIYVCNMLSDSLSVVDVSQRRAIAELSLGPQSDLTLAERGELLFYDGRLSLEGWMSCHSCHPDGHTNNQLIDNLSDGSYGDPKRSLTLLGAGDTRPWAWNGGMPDIERQLRLSITSTMQGRDPTDEQIAALAAFVRSLEPPPKIQPPDRNAVEAGQKLFDELGCRNCHPPPSYTAPGVFDVGLSDEHGRHEFNPPSLRGVSQRDRYFHDNRAATLDSVFSKHKHQLKRELSEEQLAALVTFLRSL